MIDPGPVTGIALDPADDTLYVNKRGHIAAYDSDDNPVMDGGEPLSIGEGSLIDGNGLAVSSNPGTAGTIYVADEGDGALKAYDPAEDVDEPELEIDGAGASWGGFTSLRDSSLAVSRTADFDEEENRGRHGMRTSHNGAGLVHEAELKHYVRGAGLLGLSPSPGVASWFS